MTTEEEKRLIDQHNKLMEPYKQLYLVEKEMTEKIYERIRAWNTEKIDFRKNYFLSVQEEPGTLCNRMSIFILSASNNPKTICTYSFKESKFVNRYSSATYLLSHILENIETILEKAEIFIKELDIKEIIE